MRTARANVVLRVLLACLVVLLATTPALARKWGLGTGVLKIEAELVSFDGKNVKLRNDSGLILPMDISRLSEADQQYLKTTYPNGLKAAAAPADEPQGPPAEPPANSDGAPASDAPAADVPAVAAATRPAARPAGAPPASGGLQVEVVSMSVTKPPKAGGADGFVTSGMNVRLLVTDPKRTITGLDAAKSKITQFIDNMGTNLMGGAHAGGLIFEVGPDGHSGTIEVAQPGVPNSLATKLRMRGELHLVGGESGTEAAHIPFEVIFGVGL